jgi:hypothetical protein
MVHGHVLRDGSRLQLMPVVGADTLTVTFTVQALSQLRRVSGAVVPV